MRLTDGRTGRFFNLKVGPSVVSEVLGAAAGRGKGEGQAPQGGACRETRCPQSFRERVSARGPDTRCPFGYLVGPI